MSDSERTEHRTEFRIESRAPRERTWRYRAFTGSTARDEAEANARIERAVEESPAGWRFRVVTRHVTITLGPWEPVRG